MNAEDAGRKAQRGPEGSSPGGDFSPLLGPEPDTIILLVTSHVGVLVLQDREINFGAVKLIPESGGPRSNVSSKYPAFKCQIPLVSIPPSSGSLLVHNLPGPLD